MNASKRSVTAIGRQMAAATIHHWIRLDTDWKSVVVGFTIFVSIVLGDVPIPG